MKNMFIMQIKTIRVKAPTKWEDEQYTIIKGELKNQWEGIEKYIEHTIKTIHPDLEIEVIDQ